MIFKTSKDSSPNWNPKIDFDHEVSFNRNQTFLTVFPNLSSLNSYKKCILTLNCFGLRYKHIDKFKVITSLPFKEEFKPVDNPTGSEMFKKIDIHINKPKGTITLTDSFSSYDLRWELTKENIVLQVNESSVAINFDIGVIDIPEQHKESRI